MATSYSFGQSVSKSTFMNADRLPRSTMPDLLADRLRHAILRGEFEPGQRLKESELARRYAVTNIVIREAFHKLEGEGLIVHSSYRGRSVFQLDGDEFAEIILMRASLEAQAAFWAALRMDDAARRALESALEHIRGLQATTYEEIIDAELNFHRTLWAAARNNWLSRQLNQLVLPLLALPVQRMICQFGTIEQESANIRGYERSGDESAHSPVAQAVLRGDAREARDCMIRHIMHGSPALVALRSRFFESNPEAP